MIGLLFGDINYAADGGLYAEMIENRSFELVEAFGDAREDKLYYSLPYKVSSKEIIIKIVNANEQERELCITLDDAWKLAAEDCIAEASATDTYTAQILTGPCAEAYNSIENPENVSVCEAAGSVAEKVILPALSFSVICIKAEYIGNR